MICCSTDAAFETASVPVRNQALAYSASELFTGEISKTPNSEFSTSRMYIMPLDLERININIGHTTGSFSIAFAGDYFGAKDIAPNIDYSEYIKAVKVSFQPTEKIKLGAQFKNYRLLSVYSGGGFGFDFGLQTRLLPQFNLTLELRDLANRFNYSTGKIEKKPLKTVVLAEYDFRENSSFYIAISNGKIAIGNEFYPVPDFAIRVGLNDGYWSGGIGIDKEKWCFEYALNNSLLGNQQSISVQRSF